MKRFVLAALVPLLCPLTAPAQPVTVPEQHIPAANSNLYPWSYQVTDSRGRLTSPDNNLLYVRLLAYDGTTVVTGRLRTVADAAPTASASTRFPSASGWVQYTAASTGFYHGLLKHTAGASSAEYRLQVGYLDSSDIFLESATFSALASGGGGTSAGEAAILALWGTLTNTGGTAKLGAILGDVANSPIATRLTNLATELGNFPSSLAAILGTPYFDHFLTGDVTGRRIRCIFFHCDKVKVD